MSNMVDRLIARSLTALIVSMISGLAAASLIIGYYGLMQLLTGQMSRGGVLIAISPLLIGISFLLIRHREDLTDQIRC
ncbi:MAG TPA: hypothetical protein VH370_02355 [Humisphaera sp.]|jgi:hypothetical protein|nr:hypothetical protein [Humisphaera sp.]